LARSDDKTVAVEEKFSGVIGLVGSKAQTTETIELIRNDPVCAGRYVKARISDAVEGGSGRNVLFVAEGAVIFYQRRSTAKCRVESGGTGVCNSARQQVRTGQNKDGCEQLPYCIWCLRVSILKVVFYRIQGAFVRKPHSSVYGSYLGV
jgi:hypothetical protein